MSEIAQTVDHALRILEVLGEGEALTLTQLSERLDLNRTVVHRLLRTLGNRSFVLRQGSVYVPGPAFVRIASVATPDLRAIVAPVLEGLSGQVGETTVFHVVDGGHAVVLDQFVATKHVVQVSHRIGSRHPLALGASGRAILANLPSGQAARALRRVPDAESIQEVLAETRRVGFAVSHDELQDGVYGIAVPVRGPDGNALGSIAVLTPVGRASEIEEYAPDLLAAAAEVEAKYGASAPA